MLSCSKQSFKVVNLSFKVLIPNFKTIIFSHNFINLYSQFSPLSLSKDNNVLNTWFSDFKAVHSPPEIHSESARRCYQVPSSARVLTEPGQGVSTLLHPPLSPLRLHCVWKVRHAFNCVIQGAVITFPPIISVLLYTFLYPQSSSLLSLCHWFPLVFYSKQNIPGSKKIFPDSLWDAEIQLLRKCVRNFH